MKLKNVTLATALLIALTGCGSSGGGSNNSAPNAEINNNQATQAQIEQQKSEVEKLKQQLSQAQNTQKQAEDKLKATENSSKADVATAQKNLADAQAKLANIQQNLAQAEKNLAENKTNQASLQKQLSQAQQAVEQAKLAKENSEKALNQQLQSKENDVAQAKKSLEDANAQLSTAQEKLNKLQNRLDNLPTNQKEFDKQFIQAQKALEDAKQAKLDAETSLNKQIADRNADLAKMQENLTASNNKLAQAEKELKAAQASAKQSNSDKSLIETHLNQAKKDLEAAQKSKEKAEKTLKDQLAEKEQLLNTVQKEKNDAYDKLQAALDAKQKAEKALADKNALEQPLDKARTLEFALNGGLNNQDAQDFSERYKDKSKSELQEILNGWHKHIRLLNLARDQAGNFGFYDNESRETFAKEFAKENKDKTVDEAYEVLNEKLKQHNAGLEKERLEHEKQVNALVDIAKEQGLSEDDARYLASSNSNLTYEDFSKLLEKRSELVDLAKQLGLSEQDIRYHNFNQSLEESKLQVEKQAIDKAKRVFGLEKIPEGEISETAPNESVAYNTKYINSDYIYNQKYSVVVMSHSKQIGENHISEYTLSQGNRATGLQTLNNAIPSEGSARYVGKAFNADNKGSLQYDVDFSNRTGQGEIIGINEIGTVQLNKGNFQVGTVSNTVKIQSSAQLAEQPDIKGYYTVDFFGKNAEEVAGVATLQKTTQGNNGVNYIADYKYPENIKTNYGSNFQIGFGGTRGEIQK